MEKKYISKLLDGDKLYYLKDSEARANLIDKSEKGAASGVATLDTTGKVPASQLPSYVDDVLEYISRASFPATGETGKIYIDKATNLTWRWSGSTYVEISPSLALGETSSTAYAGDKGKALADKLPTLAEKEFVNSSIITAAAEIKGSATSACDTLGEAEALISAEATRAEAAEEALDGRVDTLEEAVGTGGSVDSRISSAVSAEATRAQATEQLLQEQYNALTQSDIVVGVLPVSGTKNLIYRVPGTNSYSDYMWNGTQFVKMAEYDNAIDDEPTAGSDNLVKSRGVNKVFDKILCLSGCRTITVTFTENYQFSENVGLIPAGSIIKSLGGLQAINLYQTNNPSAPYENITTSNLPYVVQNDSCYFRALTSLGTYEISFIDAASDLLYNIVDERNIEYTENYQFYSVKTIPSGSMILSLGGASELNFFESYDPNGNYINIKKNSLPCRIDKDIRFIRTTTNIGKYKVVLALPLLNDYVKKINNPLIGKEAFIQTGFIKTDGSENNNTNYVRTDFLQLFPSQTITTQYVNYYNEYHTVAAIAFYTKEKEFISMYNDISNDDSDIITFGGEQYPIPSNAYWFRCSALKKYSGSVSIDVYSHNSIVGQIAENADFINNKKRNKYITSKSSSLNDGELISFTTPTNCSGVLLSFHAKITSFNRIVLQHGTSDWSTGRIAIDNTNVYVYRRDNPKVINHTYAHGLNINTFINVEIEETINNGSIILTTLGGEYRIDNSDWYGCGTTAVVYSDGSTLTDCQLTFGNRLWTKETWVFGDSYMSHWPTIAINSGFGNCLFDGFPGGRTSDGLASFKECLKHYVPNRIIWALGMNNADSLTSINLTWESDTNSVIELCKLFHIDLILVTIPNVPSRNNTFKNQWVRNSGYRYVDINEAVGADISSSWYDGLLGNDKVHPTIEGATIIAKRFMADVPELAQ